MIIAAADPAAFYGAFAPLCFTLLGLWLIVVQTRHAEWRRSPVHRARAYTLAVNLALPGMMALLGLVDPANQTLWRVGFAAIALAGIAVLAWLALRGPGRGRHSAVSVATTWLAIALYAVILLVALAPQIVSDIGLGLTSLEVEEILLSILVFVAVNVAAFLMFDDIEPESAGAPE